MLQIAQLEPSDLGHLIHYERFEWQKRINLVAAAEYVSVFVTVCQRYRHHPDQMFHLCTKFSLRFSCRSRADVHDWRLVESHYETLQFDLKISKLHFH